MCALSGMLRRDGEKWKELYDKLQVTALARDVSGLAWTLTGGGGLSEVLRQSGIHDQDQGHPPSAVDRVTNFGNYITASNLLTKPSSTMVSSDPFEAEVTNVDIGGRPPPGKVYTTNEVWGSKYIEYRKWTGSKWKTVRKYQSTAWYAGGSPGNLKYVYDSTDVSLPGGALVKHRNRYGWVVHYPLGGGDWAEWPGRSTHSHFLEDY